jgi:hypothetical protein
MKEDFRLTWEEYKATGLPLFDLACLLLVGLSFLLLYAVH